MNITDQICAQAREAARQFLEMTFEEQIALEISEPVRVGEFPFLAFCKNHGDCRTIGERFKTLHCAPAQTIVREYVNEPNTRNGLSDEVTEFSFRHVAMCANEGCEKTQEWLNKVRESADPVLKDMIRRWDNEPLPTFRMNGVEQTGPNLN